MCFHNALSKTAQDIEHRYSAKYRHIPKHQPVFHKSAFTYPNWPVVLNSNEIDEFSWGLIPSWIKSIEEAHKIRTFTLNAASETVFEKPSFSKSIKTRRCLIPSTGFFEWQTIGKNKYPYFIHLRNIPVFSMAGIWDEWIDRGTGEIVKSFSILTTTANLTMEKIHNTKKRMPLILTPDLEASWLTMDLSEKDIKKLCFPIHDSLMEAYTVSKLVSSKNINSNTIEVQNRFDYREIQNTLL
jgi:putative SOS response-associated peptidase YedK